jgi:hypothetical protein
MAEKYSLTKLLGLRIPFDNISQNVFLRKLTPTLFNTIFNKPGFYQPHFLADHPLDTAADCL